jgi:4-carboxymuconolactone decarboxylase
LPPASTPPTIPPAQYTDEQEKAPEDFLAARKVPVFRPVRAADVQPAGDEPGACDGRLPALQESAIGNALSELAILVTTREWGQDYEWYVHQPIALKAGIKPEIAAAIADGRRPEGMGDEEAIVYDFSIELHRNKRVSDATFARADKRFGKQGVADLTGINAYYTLLAMQLNVAQY